MNKIKNDLTKELLNLMHYQIVFARNIFPRPIIVKSPKKKFFTQGESFFLYLMFDSLHNIPELIKILQDDTAQIEEYKFNLDLVEINLQNLLKELEIFLSCSELHSNYHKMKINEDNGWCHSDLTRMKVTIPAVLELIDDVKLR